jgi:hypothetical protein
MVRLQEILDCGPALIEGLISRLLAEGGKFKLLNGSWPPVVRNMNDAKTQDFMRRLADPPLRRPVSVSRPTSSAHAPA